MTDLQCDVTNCGNNKHFYCCRPDIMVSGPDASAKSQTYCSNFLDVQEVDEASDSVDHSEPNESLDIHCEARNCTYNDDRACKARHVDISTTAVNNGQLKTQCSTFQQEGGESGSRRVGDSRY